jgi:D-amino peptidase
MKFFISADIEGTAGIVSWNETKISDPSSRYICEQMTKEVNAVCEALLEGGGSTTAILIKDAHDSARNIDPSKLPEEVKIMRGWAKNPFVMMAGLDNSFDGVLFTGYHSAAGTNGNPLSHTMSLNAEYIKINGELASEFTINAYIAGYIKVPVLFLSGDKALCESVKLLNNNIKTAPLNEGLGNATISIHPNAALKLIKEEVSAVIKDDLTKYHIPLPAAFKIEIGFKEHFNAYRASFYPNAKQIGAKTVFYESADLMDILKFMFFVL